MPAHLCFMAVQRTAAQFRAWQARLCNGSNTPGACSANRSIPQRPVNPALFFCIGGRHTRTTSKKSVALYEQPGEAAFGMSHNRCIRLIRVDFNFVDPHFVSRS